MKFKFSHSVKVSLVLVVVALVTAFFSSGTLAQSGPIVETGWNVFVIRENATEGAPYILDNDVYVENAVEIVTFASGQKAGLGTDLINGATVSQIRALHIERLDDVGSSGSLYGPYFNIWVTDGLGHYAVIANEPSDPEWAGSRWDVPNWDFLRTKGCKVYEITGASGGQPGTSWVATYTGKASGLVFEDVADLIIAPPPVSYITDPANGVGAGAPDVLGTYDAYGFNWIFGDTLANYVSGDEGFVVANYSATAVIPCTTDCYVDAATGDDGNGGTGWTDAKKTIQAAIDEVDAGGTVHVAAGMYDSSVETFPIVVDKSLTLLGSQANVDPRPSQGGRTGDESVIDADETSSAVVQISAGDVEINGFTITGGRGDMVEESGAADNLLFRYNILYDDLTTSGDEAIQIQYSDGVVLEYNYAYNIVQDAFNLSSSTNGAVWHNETHDIYSDNAAIYCYGATNIDIIGNIVYNVFVDDGIKLGDDGDGSTGGIVKDNEVHDVVEDGITIYASGVTVEDNTIYNCGSENGALYLYGADDTTVTGNDIHDNAAIGVLIRKSNNVVVEENIIHNNNDADDTKYTGSAGIWLTADASNVKISGNSIVGNADYGIRNDATVVADASGNWWGDASGPGDSGDSVSAYVDYTPWLDDGTDTSADAGFQGDFSILHVDDDSPQSSSTGYIQEGVDMVSGSTVYVAAGTYTENVNVDKSVTIQGAGPTSTYVMPTGTAPVFTVSADDVVIKQLGITRDPQLVEGIRVVSPATSGLTVDYVNFTNLGNGSGNAYGVNITNNFTGLLVTNSEFIATNLGSYSRAIGIFAGNHFLLRDFEVDDSTFEYLFVGIYLRSDIDSLDVAGNTFGPFELADCTAAVAGIYIGDGDQGNFDIQNITVTGNTFTNYGRGVYMWNYSHGETIGKVDITDNLFIDSIYSSGIRLIGKNDPETQVATVEGPITIDNNTFTQNIDVGGTGNVALLSFRMGGESPTSQIYVTNNEITFTGSFASATHGMIFRGPTTNAVVSGNTLNGNGAGGTVGGPPATSGIIVVTDDSWLGPISSNAHVDISNNVISGFENGVVVYDRITGLFGNLPTGAALEIHYNAITGNTVGVQSGPGEVTHATCNWWGDVSGPSGEGPGTGDPVSTDVIFEPWLFGTPPDGQCGCTIDVQKYGDEDVDGQQGDSEAGLEGWGITVFDAQGNEVASGTTDDAGWVTFTELLPGTYRVCETQQAGWANSDPGDGTLCKEVTVGDGGGGGSIVPGPTSVTIELDHNSDGIMDSAYAISLAEHTGNTWTYHVAELNGKDLSHWDLGIGSCLDHIVAYDPDSGYEAGTDGSTGFAGVKWDVSEGFAEGDFSITLDGDYPAGTVEALVKASTEHATGDIVGPICDAVAPTAETVQFGNYQPGTIIVEKQTVPDGATESFTFSGDAAGSIADGGQIVVSGLLPGVYQSTETALAGWELTSIVCDDDNSSGDVTAGTATFQLEAGETVVCTFINTQPGSITVVKEATPEGKQWFDFTGDLGDFRLQDRGDGHNSITFSDLLPGGYAVTELVPASWALLGVACEGGEGVAITDGVAVLLEAGQDVVCTFTNNKPDAITLDSFTAVADGGEVTVAWVTVAEVDTVGFNILRSTVADGSFAQVNPGLVVALGSEMGGASYSFVDDTVEGGTTYYYVLQEVLATGGAVDYLEWPVSATPGVVMNSKESYTIYLPVVRR